MKDLKIITFGPRPQDFIACNAPIRGLYELGVEVEENSRAGPAGQLQSPRRGRAQFPPSMEEMRSEMGERVYPDLLERMAQFELTLLDWADQHKGARKYVAFADKCWPAFPEQFGFEPCYVNSRLAARGIPVACEVDIYGALSEYIGACVTGDAVTLLDINNSVPQYLYDEDIAGKFPYGIRDTFMGFHLRQHPQLQDVRRLRGEVPADPEPPAGERRHAGLHPGPPWRGTSPPATSPFYRLQCDSEGVLRSYIAQGEVLPVATRSLRRHRRLRHPGDGPVLPPRADPEAVPPPRAVAFAHCGKALYEVMKYLGVGDIAYNQPKALPYPTENPWA